MATSGSFSTTSSAGRNIKFSWTSTQDNANNKSTVKWSLVAGGSETAYGIAVHAISLNITGSNISGKSSWATSDYESSHTASRSTRYTPYGETIQTGSFSIAHSSSTGSAQFNVSVTANIYSANVSGSGTYTLPVLLVASSIALPSFQLGGVSEDMTPISVYQSVDKTSRLNYKHKIKYRYSTMDSGDYIYVRAKLESDIKTGGRKYAYICSSDDDASEYFTFNGESPTNSNLANHSVVYFQPPSSDYQYVSGGALTITLVLETYQSNGTTLIGNSSLSKAVTIPNEFKPKINYASYYLDNSYSSALADLDLTDIVIYGITKMYIVSNATAYSYVDESDSNNNFQCGVKTFKVSGDVTASYTSSNPQNEYTLSNKEFIFNITKGGTLSFNLTVVDDKGTESDGLSITTNDLSLIQYSSPVITSYSLSRVGSENYASLNCNYSLSSIKDYSGVEQNVITSIRVSYKYYKDGDGNYIDSSDAMNCEDGKIDGIVTNLLSSSKYTVRIIITDLLGNTATTKGTVTKAKTFLHFAPKGIGIAFGKLLDITNTTRRIEIGGDADNGDNFSVQINSGSSIDMKSGSNINVSSGANIYYQGSLINDYIYKDLGNYQFFHEFSIDSNILVDGGSYVGSGEWRTFTGDSNTTIFQAAKCNGLKGSYLAVYGITIKGKSGNDIASATARFVKISSSTTTEYQLNSFNVTRATTLVDPSARTTINGSFIWQSNTSGNTGIDFNYLPQIYATQPFQVCYAYISLIRIGNATVSK